MLENYIFSAFAPHQPNYSFSDDDLQKNSVRFGKIEASAIISLFSYLTIISYATYLVGDPLFNFVRTLFPGENYELVFYPEKTIWLVVGLLLGFATIIPPLTFLYKLILKEDYDLYMEWSNRKHNYDGLKIMKPITHFCALAAILLAITCFDWYIKLNRESFVVNEFFSITAKEYSMEDIVSVDFYQRKLTAKNEIIEQPHYKIELNDSNTWSPSFLVHEKDHERLFNYLSIHAGKQINRLDVDVE